MSAAHVITVVKGRHYATTNL